jgi:hypothetical protein
MAKRRKRVPRRRILTNPNLPRLGSFFSFLGTGATSSQDIVSIMQLFSLDFPLPIGPSSPPPTSPTLGIAGQGPQFIGQSAISAFFNQLITSFPHMTFGPSVFIAGSSPLTPLYCFSADQNTITVQTMLNTQAFKAPWFPATHPAYSKPLSDLEPDRHSSSNVPAYAAFTFDSNNLILNLAVFMDRWQMAVDLWPGAKGNRSIRPFPEPNA